MRNPGITLHKLPLFVWAIMVTAILLLLSLPVLAGKIVPALNLAICWEIFFIKDNQQVTYMNFMSIWNLNDCTPELSIQRNVNPLFGSYLAGLIEGDGTIVVPKEERSKKGRLNYSSIQIVFPIKDFPIIMILCQTLGHGSISKKKNAAAYIYTINNIDGLIIIARILNGKIRGSKYFQFLLLVDYLDKKCEIFELTVLPQDTSYLGDNS